MSPSVNAAAFVTTTIVVADIVDIAVAVVVPSPICAPFDCCVAAVIVVFIIVVVVIVASITDTINVANIVAKTILIVVIGIVIIVITIFVTANIMDITAIVVIIATIVTVAAQHDGALR